MSSERLKPWRLALIVALCVSIAIVVIGTDDGSGTWETVGGLLVCLIGVALPEPPKHARFRLEVADDERPPSADTTRRFVLIAVALAVVGAVWVVLASVDKRHPAELVYRLPSLRLSAQKTSGSTARTSLRSDARRATIAKR